MSTPSNPLDLADWRRSVAEMYAAVRRADPAHRADAWRAFRAARDDLFRKHPQSPLALVQRDQFETTPYFDYDPTWRIIGEVDADVARDTFVVNLPVDGEFAYTRVARVRFKAAGMAAALSLFWIEGYGGGIFLPFRDSSNGRDSYGGGRYLYDTIKGADLGLTAGQIVLDFNYAYNPSCAYNPQWVCPLPPLENQLPFAVCAGERSFPAPAEPLGSIPHTQAAGRADIPAAA